MKKLYPQSGTVVRMDFDVRSIGTLDGFEIYCDRIISSNMPEPVRGTIYIVSGLVLQHLRNMGRTDCLAPAAKLATRNKHNQVVHVPGWMY